MKGAIDEVDEKQRPYGVAKRGRKELSLVGKDDAQNSGEGIVILRCLFVRPATYN